MVDITWKIQFWTGEPFIFFLFSGDGLFGIFYSQTVSDIHQWISGKALNRRLAARQYDKLKQAIIYLRA